MTGNDTPAEQLPFLNLALPVMDEPELLPGLLECLDSQTYRRFRLYACVNQPEAWRDDPEKKDACRNNEVCLDMLRRWNGGEAIVIDRTSPGHGWTGRRLGVGFARKTVMDRINIQASPDDLIVSLDADTQFSSGFLHAVACIFKANPGAAALSLPYYHRIGPDPVANRAILRYEIYMRHYLLNLLRIGSPYAFTALGSAMAVPVRAYRAIGGITPKLSGEDFYFLQKLRKYGEVILWNSETVYPASRFSDRVFFGTGPAMIRGAAGDWSGYPVYPSSLFDHILETYLLIPVFYKQTLDTRIANFLSDAFRESDPFEPLRANHKDLDHFTHAFHEKFDGLRILQYLKGTHAMNPSPDEDNLKDYLRKHHVPEEIAALDLENLSFDRSQVTVLEKIRDFLFLKEMEARATRAPV